MQNKLSQVLLLYCWKAKKQKSKFCQFLRTQTSKIKQQTNSEKTKMPIFSLFCQVPYRCIVAIHGKDYMMGEYGLYKYMHVYLNADTDTKIPTGNRLIKNKYLSSFHMKGNRTCVYMGSFKNYAA